MPNWCYNTLVIEAEPQVIAKIKAQLSAPYESTYQKFPSDEWITETVQKDLSFWNIIRPPADKLGEYHGTHGYTADGKVGDTESSIGITGTSIIGVSSGTPVSLSSWKRMRNTLTTSSTPLGVLLKGH